MVRIYGSSDDLLEIEGSEYYENEIGCCDSDVVVEFYDGTIIRCGYAKPDLAVWYINVVKEGTAPRDLLVCENENADPYSDVFTIASEVKSHFLLDKGAPLSEPVQKGSEWTRYRDIIECPHCGFGMFPAATVFKNRVAISAPPKEFFPNFCPDCGKRMKGE